MPDISKHEKTIKQLFIGVCWEYLSDNFHKFSEANKIKIALTLAQKDMPTQLDGGFAINQMPIVKVGEKSLEPEIGTDPAVDS